jgi:hypothetical protein
VLLGEWLGALHIVAALEGSDDDDERDLRSVAVTRSPTRSPPHRPPGSPVWRSRFFLGARAAQRRWLVPRCTNPPRAHYTAKQALLQSFPTVKRTILVLALVLGATGPALAGHRTVAEATPAFDWDLFYHGRQDACRKADRIAHACAHGNCDQLALQQAQRACSDFSGRR